MKVIKRNGVPVAMLLIALLMTGSLLIAGGGPNVSGAKLYIRQNDLEQAKTVLLKEINEVNPKNEDAWYLLGYIYARQGQYDKMKEAFNKALELKPKFHKKGIKINGDTGPQFHAKHGTDLIMRAVWTQAFNGAVKRFNDALNAPDEETKNKMFEEAAKGFQNAITIEPDSVMAYRNMAAALMNIGKYEESIAPLKAAMEHNPKDPEIRTLLAQLYMVTEKDSLAFPLLEQLWNEGHRSSEVADFLSRIYLKKGQTEDAKRIYEEALKADPNNFSFRYNYGTILLQADAYDEAIEQLSKAYELDSSSADINYNLGAAYLNRGVKKREALPEDSQDKSYVEDFKKALPYLERSIKMNPDDQQVWYTLGKIAGQLNDISLAGYAFAKGDQTKKALD
ncbi:MAG: tetratricopeptide repeat protein, partial [Calditrichaeota bacterium]